jgi:hypothetical protein
LITKFQRTSIVGRQIRLELSLDVFPPRFAALLKSGWFHFFKIFLETYQCEGVCVGARSRGFGSSFKLRFVDEGFLTERTFLLFSPILLNLSFIYSPHHSRSRKHIKSKMLELKKFSQKKLIAALYK